ncbi:MAG: N-acetyltransferase, partial [Gemmatimonadales bacterium]
MTDRLRVQAAREGRDLRRFIDLPYRLHARDPLWVPPLRRDVATLLSRTKNPFFEHAEAEYFIALQGDEVVGRIAAISNRLHNETHGDRVGFFGFFECIDNQDVANALLNTAADWCRARDHDVIRGPASFSVNDECGLLVDGFETPPTLMMPHNPRYYIRLLEQAGFTKAKDLWVYQGGSMEGYVPVPERLTRATELIRQRHGITLRPLNMKDFDGEVERIKELYNAAWEKNWGFVPMTDHEIDHLAEQFKPVVIPELVPMAYKDGKLIGFGIALPDLNV